MATTEIFKARPVPQVRKQQKFSITEAHNSWLEQRAKAMEIKPSEALEQLIDFGSIAEQGIFYAPCQAEVQALSEWATQLGQSSETLIGEALKAYRANLDKATKKAAKKAKNGKPEAEASL